MSNPSVLNRLLTRLDHTLLEPEPTNTVLHQSQYERNRVGALIEHARSLHLTLEREAAAIRVQSQRQQQQAELQRQREHIKTLAGKLREISHAADDDDDDSDDENPTGGEDGDTDGREDILANYAPARAAHANSGLEVQSSLKSSQAPPPPPAPPSELRSRRTDASPNQTNASSSSATSSARDKLFAGSASLKASTTTAEDTSNVQRTETLMSHNRHEQEALTDGLLGLARALKASSQAFGASLETEKEVLARAERGLDKNSRDMESAGTKMSTLRRMAEGKGWFGRLKLYGFIGGLWLACFLLVFLGPKLRF
ncbi:uncharacterized protein K489DRAFT_313593 [Dissoconium aciculare CBS 342.82]|uniref:Synaptobrevin n=1 Tax=Dissoconium aciculare CBS 342.82 TaxID=1314786 RepID=A0A6J3MGC6_9PEZI|nr:uncharacterized protein K489DRAFT_313593 [Dissoconium aciculare CBS 342.82]KAF1825952.1 hypothetical protein K489DRAFT_313593 [Dissoconium aciculare CBS 342.82]